MEKAKQELIDMCEKEIGRGEIFRDFYKKKEDEVPDKEEKGKIALKRIPIEDSIRFNMELVDFVKNY